MGCDEVDVVRSARQEGKKAEHKKDVLNLVSLLIDNGIGIFMNNSG